ncbi:hypothetical protein RvY_16790 [Ramazzottius varieornatus]|uniref:Uncharacterized protein n=1 Tax=Ramazzottius varieornatus TaxID=947166 RepID=A0A1D1W0U1_RAMVA|nr:hypothetical protein RvY_16790 [Ramazzottius varieornatus]
MLARCNPTVYPYCYSPITTPRPKSSTTIQTTRTRLTTQRTAYPTSTSPSTLSRILTSSTHPLWASSPSSEAGNLPFDTTTLRPEFPNLCFSTGYCMHIFNESPSLYIELEDPLALSCTFNRSLGVYEADDERQYRRLPKCGSDGQAWSTPSNSLYQFVASSWITGSNVNQSDTVVSNCTAVNSTLTGQPYDAWLRTGLYNKTSMHCECYRLTFDFSFSRYFGSPYVDLLRIHKVELNEHGEDDQRDEIGSVWSSQQGLYNYFHQDTVYFAGRKPFYLQFQAHHEQCHEGGKIHLKNVHTTVADCEAVSYASCVPRSSTSTAIPETTRAADRSSSTRTATKTSTTLSPITDPTNFTPGVTNSTSTTCLPEASPHTSTSTVDSSTPHLNEQGLSRPLVDLLQAYNQTVEWLEEAPQVILQSMEKLNGSLNTEPSIDFENVIIVAQLIEHICQFNATGSDVETDNGVTTVSQVLAIVDMLIEWDHYGHLNNIDASSMPSTEVAIKIYAALDNLANLIVPTEERVEPYLFNRTSVAVKISKKVLTANDTVENLRISNTVDVRHIKDHQVFPDFYYADRQDGVGISPGILLLRVSANELEKEFHHIQEMADPTARIFSLQLTSVKAFHFADIAYSPSMAQRKARKAAPIILMTGFHRPLRGIKGLITMMGDPFVLFKVLHCSMP